METNTPYSEDLSYTSSVSSPIPKTQLASTTEDMYTTNSYTNDSLMSSTSDYQQQLGVGISDSRPRTPDREISPDGSNLNDSFSRPLSRNSTTSCLSTTATKDGIEGNRLHRHGPTAYSNNIINNMVHTQQAQLQAHLLAQQQQSSQVQLGGAKQPNSPLSTAPPISINSGLPLAQDSFTSPSKLSSSNAVSPVDVDVDASSTTPTAAPTGTFAGDKLNLANIELHNSIFRSKSGDLTVRGGGGNGNGAEVNSILSATAATVDDDLSSLPNNYSQVSIKTTNAQFDGDAGASNHLENLGDKPPITLKEKINLLDTSAVERSQDEF